jgi:short-subunit dehydrogenase
VKAVLFGATKGMGRALARRMVERGDSVCLLGRDAEELEKSVADLESRASASTRVAYAMCDLEAPQTFSSALNEAARVLGAFDTVVVSAALFAPQERLERDLEFTQRMLTANYVNTILFCELARERLLADGRSGTLCVFSSVSGERGRKPGILYGSGKAGLSAYLEGLDHKFHEKGLRVVCVKPGFVRTSMTSGLPVPPFASDPDGVAPTILRAIDRGTPVVYAPPIWALVMMVIRMLPRTIMRRVGF